MEDKIIPVFKGIQKGETLRFYHKHFTIHVDLDTYKKRSVEKTLLKECIGKKCSL